VSLLRLPAYDLQDRCPTRVDLCAAIPSTGAEKIPLYAEANRAAVEQVTALVERLGVGCQFQCQAAYIYTETDERQGDIAAEVEAALSIGLPVTYMEQTTLPSQSGAAMRLGNQA
jgi:hypothetical protein